MNHFIDFVVCALAGCTHFIILQSYFKKIFSVHFLGVQIWCSIVRAQLLEERPKGKYSTDKQLNGPRAFETVLKLGTCYLFRWIHTLNLSILQTYSHLSSETRTYLSALHWWMGKKPLESYWGDYLVTFKGVSQLKLVNETITRKAYQDNIKHDLKLQYECTMPQAFNKDNAPCNNSLKYTRIHQGPGWWYFWVATLQCRSDPHRYWL